MMRRRRQAERAYREDVPAEDPGPVQRWSGSSALLARFAANVQIAREEAPPVIEPHAPGEEVGMPELTLEDGELDGTIEPDLSDADLFAGEEKRTAQPSQQPAPANAAIAAWVDRPLTTNPEYATWILEAGKHGFATFGWNSKEQLQTYAAGKKHSMTGTVKIGGQDRTELGGSVDGSATASLLPVLETTWGIIHARASRWLQSGGAKVPPNIGWLARNWGKDAHTTGKSLDASGGIDFGNPAAGAQVVQVLKDLPPAKYLIGLPYQAPFFDVMDSRLHYTNAAEGAVKGTDTPPAAVTTPGLEMYRTTLVTATWNPAKRNPDTGNWELQDAKALAVTKIKDADVRKALAGIGGSTFAVFPDHPSHIHIQRA